MSIIDLPLDSNGKPFSKPSFWLNPKEYAKICSEINRKYDSMYRDQLIFAHVSFGLDGVAYVYWFENHGFNDYNIFLRVVDNN